MKWLHTPDAQLLHPATEETIQGGSYSSDEWYDPRKKPRRHPSLLSEQYFIIRVLVRLRYWLEQTWDNFAVIPFFSFFQSPSDAMLFYLIKKTHSQELKVDPDGTGNQEISFSLFGSPVITSTELLQFELEDHSGDIEPAPGITLIPAGSQEAYASIEIPFSTQFTNWNELDKQKAEWLDNTAKNLQLISASWSALYPYLYQLLQQQSAHCQYQILEESSEIHFNWKCLTGEHKQPTVIQPIKTIASMITLTVMDTVSENPDSDMVTFPETGDKKEPAGKGGGTQEAGASRPKIRGKTYKASQQKSKEQMKGTGGGGDDSPIVKVPADVRVCETARLILRLRQELYNAMVTRFKAVKNNREKLAEAFFYYFNPIAIDPDRATFQSNRARVFLIFDNVRAKSNIGMYSEKYYLTTTDFFSLSILKKKLGKWNITKIQRLTNNIEGFVSKLLCNPTIFLQLLEQANADTPAGKALPVNTIKEIRAFIKDMQRQRKTEFPYNPYPGPSQTQRALLLEEHIADNPHLAAHAGTGKPDTMGDANARKLTDDELQEGFSYRQSIRSERPLSCASSVFDDQPSLELAAPSYQLPPEYWQERGMQRVTESQPMRTKGYLFQKGGSSGNLPRHLRTHSFDLSAVSRVAPHQAAGATRHRPILQRTCTSYSESGNRDFHRSYSGRPQECSYRTESERSYTSLIVESDTHQSADTLTSSLESTQFLPLISEELPESINEIIDSYAVLSNNLNPALLVHLANLLNPTDPTGYQYADSDDLRRPESDGPGLLPMMRRYVALESMRHSPEDTLRKLTILIKNVVPEVRFDRDGRIIWESPEPSNKKETRL